MKITAHRCSTCKDVLYSRATHDFRTCGCGKTSVDGGFDYTRLVFKKEKPEAVEVDVNVTKDQLYDDWNNRINKYGIVKEKE
jgi:hypothetical protein